MKKLLALTLATLLALGLWVPALADEAPTYVVDGEEVETISLDEIADEDFWTLDRRLPDKDAEPTYTLVVNGEVSDAELTVTDWVTYADAAQLGAILGTDLGEGPVAVRAAAEAAGWDVVWYDGGWMGGDQQICLFDRAAYEGQLADEFGPAKEFFDRVIGLSLDQLRDPTPRKTSETAKFTITRFSTLDGDKTYTAQVRTDTVTAGGVMDCTVSFDVTDLLKAFTAAELQAMAREADFSLDRLTGLLKAGKAEVILDYNQGTMAFNVPLLGLVNEELAGWQVMEVPELAESLETLDDLDLTGPLYDDMVTRCDWEGGVAAHQDYANTVAVLKAFMGKECFTITDGAVEYALTTRGVNRAMGDALSVQTGLELGDMSCFKSFQMKLRLAKDGAMTMSMDVRPDVEGIASAAAVAAEEDALPVMLALRVLKSLDMHLTASAKGDLGRATETVELHWNNAGKLRADVRATAGKTTQQPRKTDDLPDAKVYDPYAGWMEPEELDLGIVGGADGPTQIVLPQAD